MDQSLRHAKVVKIDPYQFTHTSPGRIQRLQQGAVSERASRLINRKFHQCCGIVLGQDAREMFRLFRRSDSLGRIEADLAFSLQIAIEAAERGELPCPR